MYFRSEIEQAKTKAMEYNFSYYLLISKTFRLPKMEGRKKEKYQQMDVVYTNIEEQLFHQVKMCLLYTVFIKGTV